ncbi:hypothetical protein [Rhodococcus artemisiae]|uniref:Uncharacterized protein n=1 Tax=Rhodococcus artemisiae TaxID=714159 RepID=A0ABU7LBN2_9NOCA|nr:hypothetical protein [Rhodococcus artemisiae]MEE2058956.1 hypothetical protein [Rhodococcus artemisiae]
MTHDYCPATIDGAPAHRCLCYHQPNHHGGHECRCGHYWGIDWDAMSYDEQWRFLGLPDVGFQVTLDRFRTGLDLTRKHFAKVGDAMHGLTNALNRIVEEDHHDRTA